VTDAAKARLALDRASTRLNALSGSVATSAAAAEEYCKELIADTKDALVRGDESRALRSLRLALVALGHLEPGLAESAEPTFDEIAEHLIDAAKQLGVEIDHEELWRTWPKG
jgi:hypothetical protein